MPFGNKYQLGITKWKQCFAKTALALEWEEDEKERLSSTASNGGNEISDSLIQLQFQITRGSERSPGMQSIFKETLALALQYVGPHSTCTAPEVW